MKLIEVGQKLYNLDAVRRVTYSVAGPPWKQEMQLYLWWNENEFATVTGPKTESLYHWLREQVIFDLTENEEEAAL